MKNLSTRNGIALCVFIKEEPEDAKTIQATAIVLPYPPQLDGQPLLLKIQRTLVS